MDRVSWGTGRYVGRICRVPVPAGLPAGVPAERRNPTRGVIEYTEGAFFQKIDFEMSEVSHHPFLGLCSIVVIEDRRDGGLYNGQQKYRDSKRSNICSHCTSVLRNSILVCWLEMGCCYEMFMK